MQEYKTEQEAFWAEDFGTDYIKRNNSAQLYHSKVATWAKMLKATAGLTSVLELGCNIGLNLKAIHGLNPSVKLQGVEINQEAATQAANLGIADIYQDTILNKLELSPVDLTFTAGVLIHINPDRLHVVYRNLVNLSRRYVLVAEYYNPSPVSIEYRGHQDRLFKRDFAGELMSEFGLKLVDYGFVYKRDNWTPMDDITWFLLEK
ncbi:pseudaminic acid biosynthesis-associated methylase [Agaribacter flavus]|uniref:Pseudaminic acid biosynthesis-associated methylase n=1 Tax=Agaribacter flavus TaxID=1902781 RepID=A0ABV7FPB5_9ALTE